MFGRHVALGYGEEAGLVLRALSLIHKLQDGVRSTIQERDVLSGENFDLRAENEKLRAALKQCGEAMAWELGGEPIDTLMIEARRAAAALKETGDES